MAVSATVAEECLCRVHHRRGRGDVDASLQLRNAGTQRTIHSWDFENMCVAIALPSGARDTFAYDAALKRRSAEDAAGLVRFVHDGENVLLETDGGGATQVSYTIEPS
jgi:hypothetical protein